MSTMNLNTLLTLIANEDNFTKSYLNDWSRFVASPSNNHAKINSNRARNYETNRKHRRTNNMRYMKITNRHRYNYQNRPKIR